MDNKQGEDITVEFTSLQAFVKVVQTGSFTKAAESLHSDKAHISRVVSALEKELAIQLLRRTTRSLNLTESGREVYERSVAILAAVEDTVAVASRVHAEPTGTLKLTCGVEFGQLYVNSWLNGYLQRYPRVQADVEYTSRLVDLVHEGFDLAIRLGELQESRLSARKLLDLEYGLFASPAYLSGFGTPRRPEDLRVGHRLLQFTSGNQRATWSMARGRDQVRVAVQGRLRVNNIFGTRDAAVAGLGIARLPLIVADELVRAGRLVGLLPHWKHDAVPVHAVFPSTRYLSPKLRLFIDHIVNSVNTGEQIEQPRLGVLPNA